MTRRLRALALMGVAVVYALAVSSCAREQASDPPGLDPARGTAVTAEWAKMVEGLDAPFGDREATSCHRGDPECMDAVVAEMEARLEALGCEHTAPFAFTYLEMTRGVAEGLEEFDDQALISVIDARFAELYFDAIDNWRAGNRADVPAPWQITFSTAERGESSAALDLVLGMNAHISRDLAYVVASAIEGDPGIVDEPDDYRRVNEVIGDVKAPMLEAASDRFDPNLFLLDTDIGSGTAADPVALISEWRTFAFDLGSELANSSTAAEHDRVVAEIERMSAAAAGVLVAIESAEGSRALAGEVTGEGVAFLEPEERDRYCRGR